MFIDYYKKTKNIKTKIVSITENTEPMENCIMCTSQF